MRSARPFGRACDAFQENRELSRQPPAPASRRAITDAQRPRLTAPSLAARLAALALTPADLERLTLEPADLARLALAAEPACRPRTRLHPRAARGRTIND